MQCRTTESIVTFRGVFSIGTTLSKQPAGSYRAVNEEELLEGLLFTAYRAVSTTLQLPAIGIPSMTKQYLSVSGEDLRAALDLDLQEAEDSALEVKQA
jgi:hypothetical protein